MERITPQALQLELLNIIFTEKNKRPIKSSKTSTLEADDIQLINNILNTTNIELFQIPNLQFENPDFKFNPILAGILAALSDGFYEKLKDEMMNNKISWNNYRDSKAIYSDYLSDLLKEILIPQLQCPATNWFSYDVIKLQEELKNIRDLEYLSLNKIKYAIEEKQPLLINYMALNFGVNIFLIVNESNKDDEDKTVNYIIEAFTSHSTFNIYKPSIILYCSFNIYPGIIKLVILNNQRLIWANKNEEISNYESIKNLLNNNHLQHYNNNTTNFSQCLEWIPNKTDGDIEYLKMTKYAIIEKKYHQLPENPDERYRYLNELPIATLREIAQEYNILITTVENSIQQQKKNISKSTIIKNLMLIKTTV